jgi:glutamyl-tRNA reductase
MTSIAVVGVSHRTAPVEIRERFAFSDNEAVEALGGLREHSGMKEAVLLSTCNRTELYVCPGSNPDLVAAGEAVLAEKAGGLVGGASQYLYHEKGIDSVRHLYRVVAGMDSLILGEAEIQGQVRSAYELAGRVPMHPPVAGPVLHRLFQTALSVGGQIRSQTPLGRGAASVASVAVELARKIFGSLEGREVMILGAGNTAELVVEALKRDKIQGLIVANRTRDRAQNLANRLDGDAIHFDEMPFSLARTDILVASTGAPHVLITRDGFRQAIGGPREKPLLVLDLAIPRDVEPELGGEPNVFLYNVDDLREIIDGNLIKRQASISEAEVIVEDQANAFAQWHDARDVVPVVTGLRDRWGHMREDELEWLWQRLGHLSAEDREQVESFSKRLLNKLLHQPTIRLKEGVANGRGADFVDAVRFLHGLEDVAPAADSQAGPESGPELADLVDRKDTDG